MLPALVSQVVVLLKEHLARLRHRLPRAAAQTGQRGGVPAAAPALPADLTSASPRSTSWSTSLSTWPAGSRDGGASVRRNSRPAGDRRAGRQPDRPAEPSAASHPRDNADSDGGGARAISACSAALPCRPAPGGRGEPPGSHPSSSRLDHPVLALRAGRRPRRHAGRARSGRGPAAAAAPANGSVSGYSPDGGRAGGSNRGEGAGERRQRSLHTYGPGADAGGDPGRAGAVLPAGRGGSRPRSTGESAGEGGARAPPARCTSPGPPRPRRWPPPTRRRRRPVSRRPWRRTCRRPTRTARTNGNVFLTAGGLNYVCSGSSSTPRERTASGPPGTASRRRRRHLAANWQFVPAYSNGSAPWGVWTSRQLWTKSSWISSSDFTSDMGVSIMNTRGGWNIWSTTSAATASPERPEDPRHHRLRLPASPYDGAVLRSRGTMTQRSFFTPGA